MNEKKRRFETYSFYDHTGIARHLAAMAARGWLIEKASNAFWVYRRIEPQTLHFSVTYFPKASEFDALPSEEQETFRDFCAYTGWKLACQTAQMEIYYNGQENPVPIETDPALEVETVHKAMKRSFLPAQILLLAVAVLNGGLLLARLRSDLIGILSESANLVSGLCWLLVLVTCTGDLIKYFRWRRRARAAAERGEFLDTPNSTRFQLAILAVLALLLSYWFLDLFLSGDIRSIVVAAAMFGEIGLLVFLVNGIKRLLKRRRVSARTNLTVTLLADVALCVLMMGLTVFGVIRLMESGVWEKPPAPSLPLRVEDLAATDFDGYIRSYTFSSSFLLGRFSSQQFPDWKNGASPAPEGTPELSYTVTEVKAPFLYGPCREQLLRGRSWWEEQGYFYQKTDGAPWGSGDAYQLSAGGTLQNQYLLFYPDRIVEIELGWSGGKDFAMTPAQMAAVGRCLGRA